MVGGVVRDVLLDFYGVWGTEADEDDGRCTIDICTDGSVSGSVGAWSACYLSDDLHNNHHHVPAECKFDGVTLPFITCTSGHIPTLTSTSIYDAELEAIARALMSVSASHHIRIHCDSQSVVKAIHRSLHNVKEMNNTNEAAVVVWLNDRHHLRSAGRPWLHLIIKLILIRQRCGSTTNIEWTRAHTDGNSVVDIGNRCADEYAKRSLVVDKYAGEFCISS